MSAPKRWVGDRRLGLDSRSSVFHFANSVVLLGEDITFFDNSIAPIQAANAETRLRKVMLAPYGDWPNSRGLQRFQKADAEEIVKEFSNVINKLINPSSWLGLPWYEGHPDHPDFRGKPGHTRATAVGRIKSLEAGDDGLYANVKFNEDGERLISNESYHGHSVNWFLTRDKQSANAYRPFRLKSVGFTNEPNIPVPAVTLANGAPIGNKNAFGKHHNWFVSGHKESIDFHKPKAEYYEGLAHLGDEYKELAKFHRKRADFHQEELSKLLTANSRSSRLHTMAQMRQMANAGTSAGVRRAWVVRKRNNFDVVHRISAAEGPEHAAQKFEAFVGRPVSGDEEVVSWQQHDDEEQLSLEPLGKARWQKKLNRQEDEMERRGLGLIGNSKSRFSVMRGMREMANNKS